MNMNWLRSIVVLAMLSGCVGEPGDNIGACGQMPIPAPMFAREVVTAGSSRVEVSTEQWFAHQAWVAEMLAWGDCMGAR